MGSVLVLMAIGTLIAMYVLYTLEIFRCLRACSEKNRPPLPIWTVWLMLMPYLGTITLFAFAYWTHKAVAAESTNQGMTLDAGGPFGMFAATVALVVPFISSAGMVTTGLMLAAIGVHWYKVYRCRKALNNGLSTATTEAPSFNIP